jgi:hypothetical protein
MKAKRKQKTTGGPQNYNGKTSVATYRGWYRWRRHVWQQRREKAGK